MRRSWGNPAPSYPMQVYIIRRLLLIIPTIVIVTVIVFFSIRMIPGDVVDLMVAGMAGAGMIEDPRDAIREALGLDQPMLTQYVRWMGNLLRGDLGDAFVSSESVSTLILNRLPVSLELGAMALVISLLIALPVGIYSGIRPDTVWDYVMRSFAILLITVPSFWIALMVWVYPALWWGWAPPMIYTRFTANPIRNITSLLIPASILGMWLSGVTMRLTRTMALEVLRQDYVRTAWAKGLRERVVVLRHVLRNSLLPVVTMVGLMLSVMVGGAVIVESLFQLPGLGSLLVFAIERRDYPIISGVNLVVAGFVLIVNVLIDLSYSYLDPRIRYT